MSHMNDTEIILKDLREHGGQSSWDWQADYRFAQAIGDSDAADVYARLLRSSAPFLVQIAVQRSQVDHIRRRRLRALRKLVRQSKVESWWLGTGDGGRTEFGIGRTRAYHLKKQ